MLINSQRGRKAELDNSGNVVTVECLSCKKMIPFSDYTQTNFGFCNVFSYCKNCRKNKPHNEKDKNKYLYIEMTNKNSIKLNLVKDYCILKDNLYTFPYNVMGVYVIYNYCDEVIYVGKANCIKNRIQQHLSGNSHIDKISEFLNKIDIYVSFDEWDRDIIETYLIKEYRPAFNLDKNIIWNSSMKPRGGNRV